MNNYIHPEARTLSADDFDIVIVGGGLVGSCLAHALRGLPWRCAVIEAREMSSVLSQPQALYDERVIALSWVSRQVFEALGLWSELEQYTTPIRHIHVSERGTWGQVGLHCEELALPALGYVVTARHIAQVLHTALHQTLTVFNATTVAELTHTEQRLGLQLQGADGARCIHARLVVAATGSATALADNLRQVSHDYAQTALITTITPSQSHAYTAYERFTPDGPLALLPMTAGRCAVVWSVANAAVAGLLELSDPAFREILQAHFGWRLGRFLQGGTREAFPLKLAYLPKPVQERLVFVGNAAHTLHPVAGQGLNLGLRDVALLAQYLAEAARLGHDPSNVIEEYATARHDDLYATVHFTDTLIKTFSMDLAPARLARAWGLNALAACPSLKKRLMHYSTGLQHAQSRMTRGLGVSTCH